MALVVNIFGGPGSGKTTSAARLFSTLKLRGMDVENIDEVARMCIQTGQMAALDVQPYLFGLSLYRMKTTAQKTDVLTLDSPLLLNPIYDKEKSEALKALVLEEHNKFANLNIYLERPRSVRHSMAGRVHDEETSVGKHDEIRSFLDSMDIPYIKVNSDGRGLDTVADWVEAIVEKRKAAPKAFPPGSDIRFEEIQAILPQRIRR